MAKTFKTMVQDFKNEKVKYEGKMIELRHEQEQIEANLSQANVDLEKSYVDELATESTALAKQEQATIRQRISDLQKEQSNIGIKIDVIKNAMKSELEGHAVELKKARKVETAKHNDAFNAMFEGKLIEAKLAYLKAIKEVADVRKDVVTFFDDYQTAVQGIVALERDDHAGLQLMNLFNDYGSIDDVIGVRERDIQVLFNTGKVSPQLELFIKKGEAVKSTNDALERLKQIN
jgi:hypothetical protein